MATRKFISSCCLHPHLLLLSHTCPNDCVHSLFWYPQLKLQYRGNPAYFDEKYGSLDVNFDFQRHPSAAVMKMAEHVPQASETRKRKRMTQSRGCLEEHGRMQECYPSVTYPACKSCFRNISNGGWYSLCRGACCREKDTASQSHFCKQCCDDALAQRPRKRDRGS